MKILLILKAKLEFLPPILNLIKALSSRGFFISVISQTNEPIRKKLENNGVNFYHIEYNATKNIIKKIINNIIYRIKVRRLVSKIDFDFVWYGSLETAITLDGCFENSKTLVQILELYDTHLLYRFFMRNNLDKYLAVITPEYHRACIIKCWSKAKRNTFILHNKPFFPEDSFFRESLKAKTHVGLSKNKKILLYQGFIRWDRTLVPACEAVEKLEGAWEFWLMGMVEDRKTLDKILKNYKHTKYVGYFPPPDHLSVTKLADIGLMSYDDVHLNNIFCAPNKIWEYSLFGLPIISNDVPGIRCIVDKFRSGICVNRFDEESICQAILIIESEYQQYQNAAFAMYKSVDYNNELDSIINLMEKRLDACKK